MNTAVTTIQAGMPMAVPDYIANAFGDDTNIKEAFPSLPQLRFKGKQWRISLDGEEMALTRKNTDGDDEPIPVMKVVILDVNPHRSRAFYEGAFVEGQASAPACASKDGVTPDADIAEPQCATCAACPQAAKGSKVSDNGKAVTACQQFKRIAVVPANKLDFTPLLLRLPQTSLWDKDGEEQAAKGWFAFDQYMDMVRKNGVKHTAQLVVKIKFDPSPAYPKLLFSSDRWLTQEEVTTVRQLLVDKRADLDALIGASETEVSGGAAPAAKPAAAVAAPAASAEPEFITDPDTGDQVPNPKYKKPAATKATKATKAATPKAQPAAAPATAAAPAATEPVKEAAAQPAVAPAGSGLSSLLGQWDD